MALTRSATDREDIAPADLAPDDAQASMVHQTAKLLASIVARMEAWETLSKAEAAKVAQVLTESAQTAAALQLVQDGLAVATTNISTLQIINHRDAQRLAQSFAGPPDPDKKHVHTQITQTTLVVLSTCHGQKFSGDELLMSARSQLGSWFGYGGIRGLLSSVETQAAISGLHDSSLVAILQQCLEGGAAQFLRHHLHTAVAAKHPLTFDTLSALLVAEYDRPTDTQRCFEAYLRPGNARLIAQGPLEHANEYVLRIINYDRAYAASGLRGPSEDQLTDHGKAHARGGPGALRHLRQLPTTNLRHFATQLSQHQEELPDANKSPFPSRFAERQPSARGPGGAPPSGHAAAVYMLEDEDGVTREISGQPEFQDSDEVYYVEAPRR
jgi:hypothetical protein